MPTNSDNKSRWPVSDMLLRGTFATKTVTERRLVVSNKIVGVLVFVSVMAARIYPARITDEIALFVAAGACTYYAWEKRRYFLSLDELPRRIEMEGMAWAYSIGVLAALWLAAIGYVVSQRWPPDPRVLSWAPFLLFAILLGLVKGLYRYFATRRY